MTEPKTAEWFAERFVAHDEYCSSFELPSGYCNCEHPQRVAGLAKLFSVAMAQARAEGVEEGRREGAEMLRIEQGCALDEGRADLAGLISHVAETMEEWAKSAPAPQAEMQR